MFCSSSPEDCTQFLPWVEYVQNSLHHSTTQLTPFQCVLGYQPPMLAPFISLLSLMACFLTLFAYDCLLCPWLTLNRLIHVFACCFRYSLNNLYFCVVLLFLYFWEFIFLWFFFVVYTFGFYDYHSNLQFPTMQVNIQFSHFLWPVYVNKHLLHLHPTLRVCVLTIRLYNDHYYFRNN